MISQRILELVAALTRDSEKRRDVARCLANYLGADDLLILLPEKDPEVYLPAWGFPQTLYGGRRWTAFISDVTRSSHAAAELSYPASEDVRAAQGWIAQDGSILVLFDGRPDLGRVEAVLSLLPLIGSAFAKERTMIESAAHAKLAQNTAQQSNDLAAALDSVRRQLQATVILREQDIERLRQIEAELERSNIDLKRVNEDLTQFTYAATHDLREPLRMITVYAQLLQKQQAERLDENAQRDLRHIVDGAKRMARLIDGLLQFSQVGEIRLAEAVPVEAEEALQESIADLQIMLVENHAKVSYADLPVVLADRLYLSRVFQNLIANAVKYRRPGADPEVQVSVVREGEEWIFAVRDNGIGIAPEYHQHIFLPLKRLHGSEIAGSGIGLATCTRIVERFGGRLWVESQPGIGSVFYFSLPAVRQ